MLRQAVRGLSRSREELNARPLLFGHRCSPPCSSPLSSLLDLFTLPALLAWLPEDVHGATRSQLLALPEDVRERTLLEQHRD